MRLDVIQQWEAEKQQRTWIQNIMQMILKFTTIYDINVYSVYQTVFASLKYSND
jgi:hypothetical protein